MKLKLIMACFFMAWSSQAMEVAGIQLPLQQNEMELRGAGLLKKGLFFKIYVGALYTAPTTNTVVSAKTAKRIDIHYFHHTPKKHMIRVANKTLGKNFDAATLEQFSPKLEQLHADFKDGKKGSVASIIHVPGKGLEYRFDDQIFSTIACDHFANAYFSIWIGEHPSSRKMKEAMIGDLK